MLAKEKTLRTERKDRTEIFVFEVALAVCEATPDTVVSVFRDFIKT